MDVNDNLHHQQDQRSVLVDNFVGIVGNDRREPQRQRTPNVIDSKIALFVQSFRILLEEKYGVPPSERERFEPFWEKVRDRAKQYHAPYAASIHALDQVEKNLQLDQDVITLLQEYHQILCASIECH